MPNQRAKRHDRVKVIANLMRQDLTQAEIGRRLGVSGSSIGRTALIHGLSRARVGQPLSSRQARIVKFLQIFTTRNRYPPTVREITKNCNNSSTSVTDYNLWVLERKGYVTRIPGISRGIVLTERGRSKVVR